MALLDQNGLKADAWTRANEGEIAGISNALVPWDHLPLALKARQRDQRLGVEAPNNIGISELKLVLRQLSLVSILFPAFSDGRGFSLARHIRNHGFTGALRAHGPLIADQFAYALACGFDEIELPEASADRQPIEQWLKARGSMSHGYQRGYGDSANILDQRRAARRTGSGGGNV